MPGFGLLHRFQKGSNLKNISKGSMYVKIHNLVFLWVNVLKIINFLGKSLEFFIHNKIVMVPAFFYQKYAKKPWFL